MRPGVCVCTDVSSNRAHSSAPLSCRCVAVGAVRIDRTDDRLSSQPRRSVSLPDLSPREHQHPGLARLDGADVQLPGGPRRAGRPPPRGGVGHGRRPHHLPGHQCAHVRRGCGTYPYCEGAHGEGGRCECVHECKRKPNNEKTCDTGQPTARIRVLCSVCVYLCLISHSLHAARLATLHCSKLATAVTQPSCACCLQQGRR